MRRIAFLVFPRLTLLDFVGVYDVLRRAPGALPRVVGTMPEVTDESGVTLRTDGVYEAMNADNAEFGTARVIEIVREARGLSSHEIVDRIFAAVEVFRGDHPPNDDMTAVAVRITS